MDQKPNLITHIVTNQDRSKGGSTAAKNMTAEQRRERSLKANMGKKCYQGIPKATHSGELKIGLSTIACAVLDDGRRVITESSMFEILGRSKTGRKSKKEGVSNLPSFLTAGNLKYLVMKQLGEWSGTINFYSPKFGKAYGYEAEIIPEICKIFLDARKYNILTPSQLPTAEQAEIILHSLAKVGITALIDEATGFQLQRDHNELKKLFEKFISKELHPWTRKFPSLFFENIKRMYGLEHLKGNPKFAGHLINRYIYNEISPEVLEELKARNPITENGYRKHCHHQLLTHDVGHPALDKQILMINTLMSISDSKEEFETLFKKSKR